MNYLLNDFISLPNLHDFIYKTQALGKLEYLFYLHIMDCKVNCKALNFVFINQLERKM